MRDDGRHDERARVLLTETVGSNRFSHRQFPSDDPLASTWITHLVVSHCRVHSAAAGPHRKGQLDLPALYISSYTPTLTALIRARRCDPPSSVTNQKHPIAIGQATAAGESKLHSVGAELANIGQLVDGLATFTRIDGEESCIFRVVEELGKNERMGSPCMSWSPKSDRTVRVSVHFA